jgi:hypothetical protein
VTCPWHGARFDVTTGAHRSPPAPRDVASFPVQVVGTRFRRMFERDQSISWKRHRGTCGGSRPK